MQLLFFTKPQNHYLGQNQNAVIHSACDELRNPENTGAFHALSLWNLNKRKAK